jgi:hypothetical protein
MSNCQVVHRVGRLAVARAIYLAKNADNSLHQWNHFPILGLVIQRVGLGHDPLCFLQFGLLRGIGLRHCLMRERGEGADSHVRGD